MRKFGYWVIEFNELKNGNMCLSFLSYAHWRFLIEINKVIILMLLENVNPSEFSIPCTTIRLSYHMMTSSNENIFRVTGPLCGEFTGPAEFPTQRPVTRRFDVFFDLRLNKRLSKQSWGWWFETPRGHYDVNVMRCKMSVGSCSWDQSYGQMPFPTKYDYESWINSVICNQ